MKRNKRKTGEYYEAVAVEYLKGQGIRIIEQNFRCNLGEIDLIAYDGTYLIFVEVKYRTSTAQGCSLAAVHYQKQRRICKIALYYLTTHIKNEGIPCRFDVVGIDGDQIQWIKNAFDFYT